MRFSATSSAASRSCAARAAACGSVLPAARTPQDGLLFGSETVRYDDPRRYAVALVSTLLGGGMSSRLFQRVREGSFHDVTGARVAFDIAHGGAVIAERPRDRLHLAARPPPDEHDASGAAAREVSGDRGADTAGPSEDDEGLVLEADGRGLPVRVGGEEP